MPPLQVERRRGGTVRGGEKRRAGEVEASPSLGSLFMGFWSSLVVPDT